MAFVKIPEELLDADITAAQFRILANLIKYSFDDGHSYIGYTKLAEACYTSKGFIVKSMKELEEKGFVQISHRGKFSRSNDVLLTFENGLKKRRASGEILAGAPLKGSLNETPKGSLNESPKGSLNESHGSLNETPHKDIRFKYQDLNLNTRETGCLKETPGANSNYIAPDDVASGRTMPGGDADTVAENSAKEVQAAPTQTELEDFCLVSAFFEAFPGLRPWINISRIGGYIGLQPIGKLGEKHLDDNGAKVRGWFGLRGVKLVFVPVNKVLKGQILNLNGRIA